MQEYRYSVRQSKGNEPKWVAKLRFWAYNYPDLDTDLPDNHWKWKVGELAEKTIPPTLCFIFGHRSDSDMCGIPSHDYCLYCMRSTPRDTNPFPRMNLLRPLRK
jgi:hypothetical protein